MRAAIEAAAIAMHTEGSEQLSIGRKGQTARCIRPAVDLRQRGVGGAIDQRDVAVAMSTHHGWTLGDNGNAVDYNGPGQPDGSRFITG